MASKGWTIEQTSLVTGVTRQSLRNLVRRGETRHTVPANVTAFTMLRLLEAFPTLDCEDFLPGTSIRVLRRKRRGK